MSMGWLCFACQEDSLTDTALHEGAPIYLSASFEQPVESRTPYLSSPVPTPDEVLHAAVWATTTSGVYIGTNKNGKNSNDEVDIHATADFNDGEPKLLNAAVYPKSGVSVDFIGLHPNEGWTTENNAGLKAEFTFNGSQDVMFAPKETGTYAEKNDIDNVLTLEFKHLLTWLRIKIKAEEGMEEQVAKSWGKVKSISVGSATKVSIDLNENYSFENSVNFSEEGLLPLHQWGSDDVFPSAEGFDLKTADASKEVAYVLCEPVMASQVDDVMEEKTAEYTLYIESERRKTVELPIDLMKNASTCFEGSTRAKHFTLILTFMVGNTVMVQAEATDWVYDDSVDLELDF